MNCNECLPSTWCSPKTEGTARGRTVHPKSQGAYFTTVPIDRCPNNPKRKLKWERVDLTDGAQEVQDQGARHCLLGS